jgi:hypothetical protein
MLLKIIIFLIIFALTGFLVLKFFGKLVNLNMFTVMKFAFGEKTKSSKSLFLLPWAACFCYTIAFLFLYISLYLFPMRISSMDKNSAGGLSGYEKDGNYMVYDPYKGVYVSYFWYDAPPPSTKFTETFEVVSLFKLPGNTYYQSTQTLHSGNQTAAVITALVFLTGLYFILYILALKYAERNNSTRKISHSGIARRFKQLLKIPPSYALIIFLLFIILFLAWNFMRVHTFKSRYRDLYTSHQQKLRSELLENVSPGDTLKGRVFNGYRWTTSETDAVYDEGVRRPSYQSSYESGFVYDVEFKNLIALPVYLRLETSRALGNVEEISKHSGGKDTILPDFLKEYMFIVQTDYSVSLEETPKLGVSSGVE